MNHPVCGHFSINPQHTHGLADATAIQPLLMSMASLTPTTSTAARQLRGLADASRPVRCLTGVRPHSRHDIRQETRGLSTYNKTSNSRCKGEDLSRPYHFSCLRRPARGFASTTPKCAAARAEGEDKKTRRSRPLTILTIVVLSVALANVSTDTSNPFSSTPKGVLKSESFVPFKVVSIECTSPTTFILTVSAPAPHQADNAALIQGAWAHGLWSVEVKQPQLQIARNYTPLPPLPAGGGGDGDGPAPPAQLRFLVRRYDGGEMSTYLSRLRPGDDVWLRGPHLGFDVAARLGAAGERVVFLAGGTGVAPALQVARYLLPLQSTQRQGKLSMEIVWASRSRADCAGCPRLHERAEGGRGFWGRLASVAGGSAPAGNQGIEGIQHPVVRELQELQAAYRSQGHELEFRCVADDEAGVISGADITKAIECSRQPPPSTRGAVSTESASCYYHSQRLLRQSTQESDVELKGQGRTGSAAGECACGDKGAIGKNLLMISGPDGFVSAFVGPKIWADGAERQGPVGGVVRNLIQKRPEVWKDWLVLKQ